MHALPPPVVWIAAASLAVLFAQAAIAKLADRALFEQHLAAYRVPPVLLAAGVRLVPALELAVAVLLLTPARALGAGAAAALLALYGAAMAWHRLHGRRLDCGCGGEALPVSWALVARNAALAGVALAAGAPFAPGGTAGPGDFAVVGAAVLLATLLYAAFHQVLRHRAGGPAAPARRRRQPPRPLGRNRWMR